MADRNYDQMIWDKPALPSKVKEDEDVILVVRQDVSILGFRFLSYFLVFFFLLVLRTIIAGYIDDIWTTAYDTMMSATNVILVVLFTLYFHNYYLSLQIVTSERIIDIDQQGLFKREVNELSIDKIEDVSMKQVALFSALFNYGNVIIQTAGNNTGNKDSEDLSNGFVFNNIPNPRQVTNTITQLYQKNKEKEKKDSALYNAQYLGQMLNNQKTNI